MEDYSNKEYDDSQRDENHIIFESDLEYVDEDVLDNNFSDSEISQCEMLERITPDDEVTNRELYEKENNLAHENILRQNLIVKLSNKQNISEERNSEDRICNLTMVTDHFNEAANDARFSINELTSKNQSNDNKTDEISNLQKSSILVYNFPLSTTAEFLRTFFNKFGPVLRSLVLVRNECKKFGFIEFASFNDANKCLECSEPSSIDGHVLVFEQPTLQVVKMILAQRGETTQNRSDSPVILAKKELETNTCYMPSLNWDESDDSMGANTPKLKGDDPYKSSHNTKGRDFQGLDRRLPPRGKVVIHRKMEGERFPREKERQSPRRQDNRIHLRQQEAKDPSLRITLRKEDDSNSIIRDAIRPSHTEERSSYKRDDRIPSHRGENRPALIREEKIHRREEIRPPFRKDDRMPAQREDYHVRREGRMPIQGGMIPNREEKPPYKREENIPRRTEERPSFKKEDRMPAREEQRSPFRRYERTSPHREERPSFRRNSKRGSREEERGPFKSDRRIPVRGEERSPFKRREGTPSRGEEKRQPRREGIMHEHMDDEKSAKRDVRTRRFNERDLTFRGKDDKTSYQREEKYCQRGDKEYPTRPSYQSHREFPNCRRSPQKFDNYFPQPKHDDRSYARYGSDQRNCERDASSKPSSRGRSFDVRREEMRLKREKEELKREREHLESERQKFEIQKRNFNRQSEYETSRNSVVSHKDGYNEYRRYHREPSHDYYSSSKRSYAQDDASDKRPRYRDDGFYVSPREVHQSRLAVPQISGRYRDDKKSVQQYSSGYYSEFGRSRHDHNERDQREY